MDEKPTMRFDIRYGDGPAVDHHFCREWDEDGGCYGTRDDHGLSLEEACDRVAEWLELQAKLWRERKHPSLDAILSHPGG